MSNVLANSAAVLGEIDPALFSPSVESGKKEIVVDYNWTLLNEEGEEFNFETAQDKVVFVNLWATWCPPCIAELPSMEKLYKDYGDRVAFLFVSNEQQAKVTKFLDGRDMTIPHFKPVTNNPELLSSNSIPATYILGKDGRIHVSKKGAANWNSDTIRDLLDSLLAE